MRIAIPAVLVALAALWLPGGAAAEPHEASEALSASADAPAASLGWRGYLRGTVATTLPLFHAPDDAWRLEILPLIELHNVANDAFPNHLWRGRLALAATVLGGRGIAVGLLLEHESDHRTASGATPPSGFLVLNDFGVRVSWLAPWPRATLVVRAAARAFFLTCTIDDMSCGADLGLSGTMSVGGALEAILDAAPPGGDANGLRPFAAARVEGLVAAERVRGEARAILDVGATIVSGRTGRWQLFAIGWIGNDVGFGRARTVRHVGIATRWSWR